MNLKTIYSMILFFLLCSAGFAQKKGVTSVSASVNGAQSLQLLDGDSRTVWEIGVNDLKTDQYLLFTLQTAGDVKEIRMEAAGISKEELSRLVNVHITYDPMNPGEAVKYSVTGNKPFSLTFAPQYGAHVKILFKGNVLKKPFAVGEIGFVYAAKEAAQQTDVSDKPWMNAALPVGERVELLLAVMTPADKMELIREGWGIPGIPRLGIPDIKKVEAVHGFSYGSGATIFPQAIALGASWNRRLAEEVAAVVGDETLAAGAIQAWSPVLDVAQDARWGRCEETFGEDPVLVSQIGGAWIKGYQSKGLMTTPKHFAVHGAPLGGRDSHDVGLSEREIREVHLAPFRHVIREYDCQSLMMSYSDYLGVPVAKSRELLNGILREEWGFSGFIVSDCGAIGNLTAR
ncbi:MAG: beta-glucosidase, partial [Bacteroidales bacterium]|nr:beta-glucosidase [Bacteroidales bacterium]